MKLSKVSVDCRASAGNAGERNVFAKLLKRKNYKAYKTPLKNRSNVKTQKDLTKLEMIVMMKEINNVGMMTFRLPFVSAKNPQRCDEVIIPANAIALSSPLSLVVRFKSHSAIGNMNEIPSVSRRTVDRTAPLKITRK